MLTRNTFAYNGMKWNGSEFAYRPTAPTVRTTLRENEDRRHDNDMPHEVTRGMPVYYFNLSNYSMVCILVGPGHFDCIIKLLSVDVVLAFRWIPLYTTKVSTPPEAATGEA